MAARNQIRRLPHACASPPAAINFNFLLSPPDAEPTVRAVRIACAIMTAPAMAPLQVSEVVPRADLTTDDEILDWVKQAAETTYHPVGTCKMGSDPLAVVDTQLRVDGIAGLRVADASIMPTLTSGNTNAPSIMIGEKAADMVQCRNLTQQVPFPPLNSPKDSSVEETRFELSVPSSRWVAKLWRNACSVTAFLMPAASAAW
jgi:choline dehydrogenase-like flavoprotein